LKQIACADLLFSEANRHNRSLYIAYNQNISLAASTNQRLKSHYNSSIIYLFRFVLLIIEFLISNRTFVLRHRAFGL